jgi:asparagine synthase (glutamine-hydrolysing)
MCGISGAIYLPNIKSSDFEGNLTRSLSSISHRGPDSNGKFFYENMMFGHVRLSILDLSEFGHQPMVSKSKRFVISYNGEIYNFKELAKKYKLNNLKSTSDTEIVLELFEKYGVKIIPQFNGMFAFSILDRVEKKVFLVRDRMGIKPLYVHKDKSAFYFGSEIKAIKELHENNESKMDVGNLHEWLYYGSTLGENTLFRDIKRLLPGHYIEIDLQTLKSIDICYWSPSPPTVKRASTEELIKKNTILLERAVKRQLVSDVPVGVFLSGGIDSSAIASFASKHYGNQLSTYTVGFDFDRGVNELPKAREFAKKLGTNHHEIHISGMDVADVVEKMVEHHDQPFSDAANIPLYLLCSKVQSESKVVLQGDGGDEMFGGYRRYNTLSNMGRMKFFANIGNIINQFTHKNKQHYIRQRYINALRSKNDWTLMALLLTVEDCSTYPQLIFQKEFRDRIMDHDPFKRYKQLQQQYAQLNLSDQMALIDSQIILPDIFLEKVDRSTMAASVEVRVPFLDNDLVEFAQSIPSKIKLPKGHQKWLLKKSLEGIVPDDILYGKKTGFEVPYGFWVGKSLRELFFDNLLKMSNKMPEIWDVQYITKIHAMHVNNERDFGFLLWKILNFSIWVNRADINIDL